MQNNLFAKNDYNINYNILLDFDIYDILLNINTSTRPNIGLYKKDNSVFFKTLKPLKKGDILSINLLDKPETQLGGSKYIKNKEELKSDIKVFCEIGNKIISFIQNKKFNSDNIRKLKKDINSNKFINVNNKMIYKTAKALNKKIDYQIGGNDQDGMTNNIEVLPDVKTGSFIHHPQAIPMTQKIDKLHLLLDLIGIIPVYGIAADVVNFLLYFVRGEYSDAFYSLICMIPTVGSLIGLTSKYIVKYIYNKNPDYRKYYNSMASLKDITKELRIVENKHINLDEFAYNDDNEDFDP